MSYFALAALFYVFLWLLSNVEHPHQDAVIVWVIEKWRGRLTAAVLWPMLLMYIGLKLYEERHDR